MISWIRIHQLTEEMVKGQQALLLKIGRKRIPTLTPEDILQPNDYPELEEDPQFRYEEGILAGMQSMQTALRTLEKEYFPN